MLAVRDRFGSLTVAFLESILRAADRRASRPPDDSATAAGDVRTEEASDA